MSRWYTTLGLIVNFVGAILLILGSRILTKRAEKLVEKEDSDTTNQDVKKMTLPAMTYPEVRRARKFSLGGAVLLAIGFGLQILGAVAG